MYGATIVGLVVSSQIMSRYKELSVRIFNHHLFPYQLQQMGNRQ